MWNGDTFWRSSRWTDISCRSISCQGADFCSLSDPQVWNSAVTNGIFVRFGNAELSHDEILCMAEQEI